LADTLGVAEDTRCVAAAGTRGVAAAGTRGVATVGALVVEASEPVPGLRRTSTDSERVRDRVGMQGRPGVPAPLRRGASRGDGGGGVPGTVLAGPGTGV